MDFDFDDDDLILTARRPEADRYVRLAKVLEGVERSVLDAKLLPQWTGALRRLDDRKGDLTATWRSQKDADQFARLVEQAWREPCEDGDDVVHEVLN